MLTVPSTTIHQTNNRVALQDVRKKWYDSNPKQAFLVGTPISSTDTIESFCIWFIYQKYSIK